MHEVSYSTYYIYKDKFLSGWGEATRGSYIVSNKPIVGRKEFKLVGNVPAVGVIRSTLFGKDRHVEFWKMGDDPKRPIEIYKLSYDKKKKKVVGMPLWY